MPPPYQWACYQIVGLLHGIQLDRVYVTSANKLLTIARFVIRLIYILTESFRILFVIFWYYKAIEVLMGPVRSIFLKSSGSIFHSRQSKATIRD